MNKTIGVVAMQKVLGFLVFKLVAGFGGLALAQEAARTPEELSKLPMYERLLEGDDANRAAELKQSYDDAMEAEDWSEAKKYAQALLDLRIAKQGADHYMATDARHMLSDVEIQSNLTPDERIQLAEAAQQELQQLEFSRQGQYPLAAQLGEQVLATRKKLLGENHRDYATSLNSLALVYRSTEDYARAEQLYRHSQELVRKLFGEKHPLYATNLNNLGVLYERMGEYKKAETLSLQALDLDKMLLGESHPGCSESLHNLAFLYQQMGEYARAEPLSLLARDLTKKLRGENHTDYATSLNNLGLLYDSMGKYAKAEPVYLQARDLYSKLLGENHPLYANTLNNLAYLYQQMGEYAKAEPLFLQALDLDKKLLGENNSQYATSLNNLALLYSEMSEYAKAEQLSLQARDLFKTQLGENNPLFAASLHNLAALYEKMGEYAKAEPLYLQALDLDKNLLGENHPDYAQSLNNLAMLYSLMREYGRAEALCLQALDLRKKLLGENHPGYVNSLNNLAVLYTSMGEYAKAKPLDLRACDLHKKLLGENHPNYAVSLKNLASLYSLQGEYSQAERLLLECTRSFEMSRIARASGFQRAIGGEGQNPYFQLAIISARLHKPQQGFISLERNLARAYLDVQAQRREQTLSANQQARQSHILKELSPLESRIAVMVGLTDPTDEETNELAEMIAARNRLNVELAALAAELSTQEVSDWTAIQQAIPAGHALLSWVDVVGGKDKGQIQEYWACIVASSGEPVWVALPGSGENGKWTREDSQLSGKVREALARPVPQSNLPELIEQLRRQRFEPVLAHLKDQGITQLYVVGVERGPFSPA
jgi:tetratricopeptide (TPR) repeat protein